MRKIQCKDLEIKTESNPSASLADCMSRGDFFINNGCLSNELEELLTDMVELIDYLVERLDHADSERFR